MMPKYPSRSSQQHAILFDKCVGAGATAKVWQCRWAGLAVAIKVMDIDEMFENESLTEFQTECDMLQKSQHRNVIFFMQSFVDKLNCKLWLVSELCAGGSVRDALNHGGPMGEPEIAVVASDVLAGLAYIHSRRTIHRDIKGANVLVSGDGVVKLADFGVTDKFSTMTKLQTLIGTPNWMAPEVVKGQPQSGQADMWSLGITILEMADGHPPRVKDSNGNRLPPPTVFMLIVNDPPPTISSFGAANPKTDLPSMPWSDELHDFASRMLQKEPSQRSDAATCLSHPFLTGGDSSAAMLEIGRKTLLARCYAAQKDKAKVQNPLRQTAGRAGGGPEPPVIPEGFPLRPASMGAFGNAAGSASSSMTGSVGGAALMNAEDDMKQALKLSGRLDGGGGMNESLMGNASAGDSKCCSQCVVQ